MSHLKMKHSKLEFLARPSSPYRQVIVKLLGSFLIYVFCVPRNRLLCCVFFHSVVAMNVAFDVENLDYGYYIYKLNFV